MLEPTFEKILNDFKKPIEPRPNKDKFFKLYNEFNYDMNVRHSVLGALLEVVEDLPEEEFAFLLNEVENVISDNNLVQKQLDREAEAGKYGHSKA